MIREATRPGDSRVRDVLRASVCRTIFAYFVRVVRSGKTANSTFFSTVPAASDSSRMHCHHSSRTKKNVGHVRECRRLETFFSLYIQWRLIRRLITDKVGFQKYIFRRPTAFSLSILLYYIKSLYKKLFGICKFQTWSQSLINIYIFYLFPEFFNIYFSFS